MGRKQKLKQERYASKMKKNKEDSASASASASLTIEAAAAATTTTVSPGAASGASSSDRGVAADLERLGLSEAEAFTTLTNVYLASGKKFSDLLGESEIYNAMPKEQQRQAEAMIQKKVPDIKKSIDIFENVANARTNAENNGFGTLNEFLSIPKVRKQTATVAAGLKKSVDYEYPKSDIFVQTQQDVEGPVTDGNILIDKLKRGAVEYGCIHSMHYLGIVLHMSGLTHLAVPWFLEGSIRGSVQSTNKLLGFIHNKAKPRPATALMSYWTKMLVKYEAWSDRESNGDKNSLKFIKKEMQDFVERKCVICGATDTKSLTLRQCIGCSTCCYCCKECQTKHWTDGHMGECKQFRLLNKFHLPYAKDIREAAIHGETNPKLEKLRNKLGLTRPLEEYREIKELYTYGGKPIHPYQFVGARNDGTVWIGSTPNQIGPSSDNTATTTATVTDVMSMKIGAMKAELKGYGIYTGTFIEKSEFVDALRKARNDTDRKPKATVV